MYFDGVNYYADGSIYPDGTKIEVGIGWKLATSLNEYMYLLHISGETFELQTCIAKSVVLAR